MKDPSPRPDRGHIRRIPVAIAGFLAMTVAACTNAVDHEAEHARRARQMRDVNRMLDAMEGFGQVASATSAPPAPAPSAAVTTAASRGIPDPERTPRWRWSPWALLAGGGGIGALAFVLVRRRRRPVASPAPSIAAFFVDPADDAPEQVPDEPSAPPPTVAVPVSSPSPTWTYQPSRYEAPGLHMVAPAVDLLVPPHDDRRSVPEPTSPTLRATLANVASDAGPFLVGDPTYPRLRLADTSSDGLRAWRDVIADHLDDSGDDERLARWLAPAVDAALALELPPRDAARHMTDIVADVARLKASMAESDRPHAEALLARLHLANIERLSGATRLFAIRELAAGLAGAVDPLLIDARIDVLLAWASWSLGAAASARLDEAETACDALASEGGEGGDRARRRRGEILLHRAALCRTDARLARLDEAQRLLDEAYRCQPDAETALLLATAAERRAALLPAPAAEDACTHALVHAFLAEASPAWRSAALARRRAIQRLYESLPSPTETDPP
ncbi:hypothetical protein [Luteibacter sp. 3190]|uniref:hypothetical protein n=1 Tax=Luteibacter sp. 3190 TaxID=2817736 RepID=UPI0028588D74|nr:hypothetical protein [Luteibacter sp. 3190]MDR6936164.1 hypothetical protein [Luteibacter sp. 3190]